MPTSQPQRQSPLTKNILDHLAAHAPCNFDALFDLFGDGDRDRVAKNRMHQRLSYLVCQGLLQASTRHGQRYWGAPQADEAPEPDAAPADAPAAWIGSVAQPPRIDVMRCPVYVPERAPVLRAGALDFKRHASVGDRC